MRYSIAISALLSLFAESISATTPRNGLVKRDTQLTCPSGPSFDSFDILCAADSGATICHSRLDTCCQLPDGKTPYSCPGFEAPNCCGTDKPACGTYKECKNDKGDRDVTDAESAVSASTVEVENKPTKTATTTAGGLFGGGSTGEPKLSTITGEKNPNATGGAMALDVGRKNLVIVGVIAAAVALL